MATKIEVRILSEEELKDKVLETYKDSELEVPLSTLILIIKRRVFQYHRINTEDVEVEKVIKELVSEGKIKLSKKTK